MSILDNFPPTKQMQAIDAAHHIHPFIDRKTLNKRGVRVITRAEGIYLWDSDGNRLLDAMAGLWCVNIGYGRTELAHIAARQMTQLPYYNTLFQSTHPPALTLAQALSRLAPEPLNHVFFSLSGSDANDTNIRLVRHYWASCGQSEKTVIIARKNAYHGSTVAAASLGGMAPMHRQGGLPIPDIVHIDQPYWYGEGGDMSRREFALQRARRLAEEIDKIGAHKVAAFIAEPIQGAGGVVIPDDPYWPEIGRICRERDILLIADEVITAFGRTGNWFGAQTFDIHPDIMTLAKGLSSGYLPIGASLFSDHIADTLTKAGGELLHGYTYSAHPVACAVALENLRILEEEHVIETVAQDTGPYLQDRWRALDRHPLVGEARICGMMGAIELTPDKCRRAPFAAPRGTAGVRTREICLENGLIMRAVNDTMVISPPLIITRPEIDELINRATRALDQAFESLERDGLLHSA